MLPQTPQVLLLDGRLVARRRAERPAEQGRLRAEAERLRRLAGLAVPELVGISEGDGEVLLDTRWEGTRTLAAASLPVAELARLGAALARTLAEAHERGVTHGALEPEHVVLRADGSPVLGGWDAPSTGRPEDDVASLAALLSAALPERRSPAARALRVVLDQAAVPTPEARPSARAFAEALAAVPLPTPTGSRARMSLPRPAAAVVAVVAVVVAAGGWVLLRPASPARSAPAMEVALEPAPTTTSPPPRPRPTVPVPTTRPAPPPWTVSRDADGTPLVRVDEVTYRLGAPGDQVAVGDWDCDGRPTPALLRPAAAELYVFPRWAGPGEAVEVSGVPVEPSTRGVRAPEGCGPPELSETWLEDPTEVTR